MANDRALTPETETRTRVLSDRDPGNPFKEIGGSLNPSFNSALLRQALGSLWAPKGQSEEVRQRDYSAVGQALSAFKPKDEIEGMIAAQAVALHNGAMECFRRAILPDQPAEIASRLRRDGANLSRAMTDLLDALARKRGKGPQVVRVERVVVQDGGQAIVGNVQPVANGGGGA
jgi:hypothetical protein